MYTYFKLAEEHAEAANILAASNFEYFSNICCYHLEQALEHLVRQAVTAKGVKSFYDDTLYELYCQYVECGYEEIELMEDMYIILERWKVKPNLSIHPWEVEKAKTIYEILRDSIEDKPKLIFNEAWRF